MGTLLGVAAVSIPCCSSLIRSLLGVITLSVRCCSTASGSAVRRGAGVASDGVGLWECGVVVVGSALCCCWVSARVAGPGHVACGGLCGAWGGGEVAISGVWVAVCLKMC